MIIFDLDGTLADCEHRKHFIEKNHYNNMRGLVFNDKDYIRIKEDYTWDLLNRDPLPNWKPDFKAFYEACDNDAPIEPTITIIKGLFGFDYYDNDQDVHIWSGRCESVREKTQKWLDSHCIYYNSLKMRPFGDYTPDDQLKERWLKEHIAGGGKPIEMVFDDRPKVIRMWRSYGIFVFNCCQHEREF